MATIVTRNRPSWEEDQKNPRFLITVEPTEEDLKKYTFLRGIGGLVTKYRHPAIIFFCDVYNVMRISTDNATLLAKQAADLNEEIIANEENWSDAKIARTRKEIEDKTSAGMLFKDQAIKLHGTLENLREGKYPVPMSALEFNGPLWNNYTEEEFKHDCELAEKEFKEKAKQSVVEERKRCVDQSTA